ncbi:hypothetical protein chiPu_0002923 [Chiloscyllium punctatum]|uniref:Uncharacterized protein n=1 Tax=Chiloscyllium punctatum TaxID=137246 RepID=A0A401S2D2_CHIPU|nr:hypothetical protein [Chiloscyllium punctatum]
MHRFTYARTSESRWESGGGARRHALTGRLACLPFSLSDCPPASPPISERREVLPPHPPSARLVRAVNLVFQRGNPVARCYSEGEAEGRAFV